MTKPLGILFASALLLIAAGQSHALSVSVSGGSDYYSINASQMIFPSVRASVGYLSAEHRDNDSDVYSASLMFTPMVPVVNLAVGGRYQYQDTDFGSGGGLGLGGTAFVNTPIPRVSVGGYGFYTPDGLTHGDVNESYEYGGQVRATLFAQTHAHVGYHFLRTDFDGTNNQTLHSGPVFGVSVGF